MMRALAGFLCLVWFTLPACATDLTPVTVKTTSGPVILHLEIAITPEEHEKGLMFRTSIPDREGMLFAFSPPQEITMWMKNTLVPLDMIFIDENGIIINIAAETTPKSLDFIPSGGKIKAAIEVAGGTAARYHIAKGDHVLYSLAL